MANRLRPYNADRDYALVSAFLTAHHQPNNADGNWLEPEWEYAQHHSALDRQWLDRIGIWEEAGTIVGIVNYEAHLGDAFFQFHPAHRELRSEMLDYAEAHLFAPATASSPAHLTLWIADWDAALIALAQARGYQRLPESDRPLAIWAIPNPFPPIALPEGYSLTSLAEEPDWAKVHRVLWRGFDHEGEPPPGQQELDGRRRMFDTPRARRDLKIAVRAPNGDFVAFCGTFFDSAGRFCYVEPVATDPDFRRMGLGRAAVLEGVRRCGALGATVAYVGSDQPFYRALGFRVLYTTQCWHKVRDR